MSQTEEWLDSEKLKLTIQDQDFEPIDRIRATVDLTKEAARAISITAMEAVREGAVFMGSLDREGN